MAGQYFWHRFYSHQPDLNFQNPRVRKEILDTADFWLGMGVDGFRLDAVPYLYEEEGTSCENLPATHAFLRELRAFVEQRYPGRLLLAEANQWPDDAAKYLGQGDECHMAYHFPLMPRLFMAVRMEDRFPITEILEQTPPIPDSCQWALFLRNHDELTLEMVTDEERDYMYRVYAAEDRARINLGIRRRLAPLLGHNRRLIELMNALLLSMRGTPVIYYGDELGMGDNIYLGDRDGVRTPMQWSADRNAGFSRANPQRLYMPVIIDPEYHYESVNVDAQQANPSSLLWWMRRLLALRNRHLAFSRGSMTFVEADNHRVLAFVREYEGERVLVVANLSRFAQAVNLQLGFCSGIQPVEMFGNAPFPAISSEPYFLSMGPHAFFWFVLSRAPAADGPLGPPVVRYGRDWDELFNGRRAELEALLSDYIPARRWFGARNRRPRQVTLVDVAPLRVRGTAPSVFVVAQVAYDQGEPDRFVLLLSQVGQERAAAIERQTPWAIMAHLEDAAGNRSCLVDGFAAPEVSAELPEMFRQRTRLAGTDGLFSFTAEPAFRRLDEVGHSQPVRPCRRAEQHLRDLRAPLHVQVHPAAGGGAAPAGGDGPGAGEERHRRFHAAPRRDADVHAGGRRGRDRGDPRIRDASPVRRLDRSHSKSSGGYWRRLRRTGNRCLQKPADTPSMRGRRRRGCWSTRGVGWSSPPCSGPGQAGFTTPSPRSRRPISRRSATRRSTSGRWRRVSAPRRGWRCGACGKRSPRWTPLRASTPMPCSPGNRRSWLGFRRLRAPTWQASGSAAMATCTWGRCW